MTEQPAPELVKPVNVNFPPLPKLNGQAVKVAGYRMAAAGFELLKADRHKLNMNNELADTFYSDGLVDVSVFVQRPLASHPSGALTSGATTCIFIMPFDVSVLEIFRRQPRKTLPNPSSVLTRL